MNRQQRETLFKIIVGCELNTTAVTYTESNPLTKLDLSGAVINCRGLVWSTDNKFYVAVNPAECPTVRYQVWNMLHEVGHIALGHLALNPRTEAETETIRTALRVDNADKLARADKVKDNEPWKEHETKIWADKRIDKYYQLAQRIEKNGRQAETVSTDSR